MKKSKLFFIILFNSIFCIYSQAPSYSWSKANFGYVNDQVNEVAIDTDGNVIEVGFFQSATNLTTGLGAFNLQGNTIEQSPYPSSCTNCPYGDSYIAKYNQTGALLWYLRTSGDYSETISSVTTDSQNNIYICGTYLSPNMAIGNFNLTDTNPYLKGFITKVSPGGNILWSQKILSTLGSYPQNRMVGVQLVNIKSDAVGNVYISGQMRATSITSGSLSLNLVVENNTYRQDCFIAKYDSAGNPMWLKGVQGNGAEEITKIDVDPSGSVYFSGISFGTNNLYVSSSSFPTSNLSYNDGTSFTAKLNPTGGVMWLDYSDFDNNIGFFNFDETASDSQGNVYAIGYVNYGLGSNSPQTITFGPTTVTVPYVPNVRRDNVMVICKYSATGQKLWMKALPPNLYMRGVGIEIDINDTVYLLGQYVFPSNIDGFSLPNANFISNSVSLSNPEYKTFIASMDGEGNVNWARQTGLHYSLQTTDFEVYNNSIVQCGLFVQGSSINFDGNILMGYPNSSTFRDGYIVKFNAASLSNPEFNSDSTLKIYPNPVLDNLNVQSYKPIKETAIYDLVGKLIIVNRNAEIIDVSNLAPGVYILKAINFTGDTSFFKFIKN